jgi:hypothetical protein
VRDSENDLDVVFSNLVKRRAGGLVISADKFFSSQSAQLAALALRHAVPTVSPYREFVTAGGLMSYGASITDLYRLVGVYVGRILEGEKPADLPVQERHSAGRRRCSQAVRRRKRQSESRRYEGAQPSGLDHQRRNALDRVRADAERFACELIID